MASTKATNGGASADYEDLSAQITTIREDIASLTDLLGDIGARRKDETLDAARDRAERLRAKASEHAADARNQVTDARDEAFDLVRRQPGTAIALAVGAGFIAGLLSGRR